MKICHIFTSNVQLFLQLIQNLLYKLGQSEMGVKHCPQQMAASVSHLPATKLSLLEQLSVGRRGHASNKWSRTYLAVIMLPDQIILIKTFQDEANN